MTFARCLQVELRRAVDTRASRWLLLVLVLLCVGAALLAAQGDAKVTEFVGSSALPLPFLLPVLAVLAATGDWTHRSALTTYALVPARRVVLGARLVATIALVLTVALVVVTTSVGVFSALHIERPEAFDWVQLAPTVWGIVALALAAALSGLAMGSLLLNTPLAIVITMLVPIAYDLAVSTRFPVVGPWVSSLAFSQWLSSPVWSWTATGEYETGLGPAATSLVLWTLVPLALGWTRQLRREVR